MADEITQVEDIIMQLQNRAFAITNSAVEKTFNYVETAINTANNTEWIQLNPNSNQGSYIDILKHQPFTVDMIPSINANDSDPYLNEWLKKYRLILEENFNNLLSFDLAEDELVKILQNGYLIKLNISQQIVSRVTDNENVKRMQLRNQALGTFSSNGWTIPNSVLLQQYERIDSDYSQNVSEVIRDIALKEEDLNTDMYKMAITTALQLKPACIKLAADFATSYAQNFGFGADNAKAYIAGLNVINSSIQKFDDQVINVAQLGLEDRREARDYDLKAKSAQVNLNFEKAKVNIDTLLKASGSLSSMASSGLNAQTTIAQLGSSAIVSRASQ